MSRFFSLIILTGVFAGCAASAEPTESEPAQSTAEGLQSCGALGQVCCGDGSCNAGLQPNHSLGYCRCANRPR